jgi:ABC-2 type transport system permease protein
MTGQAGEISERVEAPSVEATSAATRPLYWSVRRELWESRSIYAAPLAVAALFLFGFLISLVRLPEQMRVAMALDAQKQHEALMQPYDFAALAIMATSFLVALLYCVDALSSERRDRSVLFWKSLPVSDRTAVLAKASIPLIVIQLLSFAITVVTQGIMLLVSTAVLAGNGLSATTLWAQVPLFQMWWMLLYHYLTVHALWYAPIYAWLLMVSAWARRAAFLWASLPLLAICILERLAFNTTHFVDLLEHRIAGAPEAVLSTARGLPIDPMAHLTPVAFLSAPGLWLGLAIAAVFIATAIRLRRYRA